MTEVHPKEKLITVTSCNAACVTPHCSEDIVGDASQCRLSGWAAGRSRKINPRGLLLCPNAATEETFDFVETEGGANSQRFDDACSFRLPEPRQHRQFGA
jgi:hypothetical protein